MADKPNVFNPNISDSERAAAEEMKRNTEEQIRKRDEQLKKAEEMANKVEADRAQAMNNPYGAPKVEPQQEVNPNIFKEHKYSDEILQISQPQLNQSWDLIPLPSKGKLYPSKKDKLKIAYLTTSDEDILTSPNLIESGDFIEILFNRKILNPEIRYRDLLMGDRNAIMIWLRATAYGTIYPITVTDDKGESFEHDFDLSTLKTIELKVDPDENGFFDFKLPITQYDVKFKLLTIGEVEDLAEYIENTKDNLINREGTLVLENQIVSVNGETDRYKIREFVQNMRIADAKALRTYINDIEPNVDMVVDIRTPGGGSLKTFLPLTQQFLWPDL